MTLPTVTYYPKTDRAKVNNPGFGSYVIRSVHKRDECSGRACVIHNPSDHSMRDRPLHWRNDRFIFERICEHGVGHPDPDQTEFWQSTDQAWQGIHGCDGCCRG